MKGTAAFAGLAGLIVVGLLLALLSVLAGEDPHDLWSGVRLPLIVLAAGCGLVVLVMLACCGCRLRNRARRVIARYQLVLSQADEASLEDAAAALEQLVQVVREAVTTRLVSGQPWLAIESWFLPPARAGETGTTGLMLLCEPRTRERALAALRRAYPDLALRTESRDQTPEPLEFAAPAFRAGHVLRVCKARGWGLPLGSAADAYQASAARSTMAAIIRQQQQLGRLSCVRWCVVPASDRLDSRAADHLGRLVGGEPPNPARSGDVVLALQSAGGAMAYLELQAAVERGLVADRRGRARPEAWSELQAVCRDLLSPALSQRGANHLTERLMIFRQRLYARRWPRAEPPLLPDARRSTLVSPRELALLMRVPSLGSEHALPLQRNTVPNLPIPVGVPRARTVDLPAPIDGMDEVGGEEEVIDAELVWDEP